VNVNVVDRSERNTAFPPRVVDNGDFRVQTLALLDQAVSMQSVQPYSGTAKSQNTRNVDILTVSLSVVSMFLVLLVVLLIAVVVVFCRCNQKHGGCRWPTQRSLFSVSENGDSLIAGGAPAKHNGTEHVSSEFCCYSIKQKNSVIAN